jgi:hypothetical protein
MYNDELCIFEKYLEVINEAKASKMQGRGTRPDVFGSKQHLQKTAYKGTEGAKEAHGFNLASSRGISQRELGYNRQDIYYNALRYYRQNNMYYVLFGEESTLDPKTQNKLKQFIEKEYPDHIIFSDEIDNKKIISFWNIPKAIETFSMFANIEPKYKDVFIKILYQLYNILSDENNFKNIYNFSPKVMFLRKSPVFISSLFNEYKEKIEDAKTKLSNNTIPSIFLLVNSSFPRKQDARTGRFVDAPTLTGETENQTKDTAYGQTKSEPESEVTGFDPISPKKSPIKPGELEAIRIKSPEQAEGLPQKLTSLGKTPDKKPKRKIKKESYEPFIKLIPF